MKIFKKFKFINRFAKVPREIFSQSKALNLSTQDLDVIFKLLNFSISGSKINPNLSKIVERSGTSIRTFQRSFSVLKEKGYLEIQHNKDEKGRFTTNSYNINGLFNKLDSLNNQLYIDFDSNSIFWARSSALNKCSFIATPKALDFFQKKLNLSCKETIFIKYLFWYINDEWFSEISLNITAKTTPLSRTILQKLVKSLQEKELLWVKEQFHWRSKIRIRNRYDLNPLLKALDKLEKKKVEEKLKEKWLWKDFSKERKFRSVSPKIETKRKNKKIKIKTKERMDFLKNEIQRLQPKLISKNSEVAEIIRQYQTEYTELKYCSSEENNIWSLIKSRLESLKNNVGDHSEFWYRAKLICDQLNWNWKSSFNMYIKAVKLLPGTIDRFVGHSLEKGINKERYFATCVSRELQKLKLV